MPQKGQITKHEWKQWRCFKWEKFCPHCETLRISSVQKKGTSQYRLKGSETFTTVQPPCITSKITEDDTDKGST